MKALQRSVVLVLLGVWSFPAVGLARPAVPTPAQEASPFARETRPAPAATPAPASETAELAQREQRAKQLQDFRGGAVSIYVGSGVLLAVVIVLLILLI